MNGPVVPIPPSYDKNENLNLDEVYNYINFLEENNVDTIMTTAGTSQFNLLTDDEIDVFNDCISNFKYNKIIGLPMLSYNLLKNKIIEYNKKNYKNTSLILVYPERYYDSDTILNFFDKISRISEYKLFIHGLPLRRAVGGIYNWNAELVNKLNKEKIIGMKEESSSFEIGYELCRKVTNFNIIVAGKSALRFSFMYNYGANTFLSGIGNIFPKLEKKIYNDVLNNNFNSIRELEMPFFDVFMKIGWHKALRSALKQKKLCCNYNRMPFPNTSKEEELKILNILKYLESKERI